MRLEEAVPTFSTERVKRIYGEGNVSQVYLFEGPTGVGKTTVARIVSRASVCEREDKPCLECEACEGMESSSDFLEINVANFRGIDAIRSLQEQVYYRPSFLKRKIFILDEVHQLTNDSQQLLLKVLEEPPPGVLFFLCTTAKGSLKRTLIDRASTVRFLPVTGEQAYELIDQVLKIEGEENSLKDTERNRIITTSEGSVRALLNGVQAFLEGDTAADWGQDDVPGGVPELAKALVAKDWPGAREVLASTSTRKSPESIRIGVSNYLRAVILKKDKASDCIPLAQPLGHMAGTLADEPAIDQYNQLVLRCLRACYKS
jgi:DNA polymerase-3 subunit gamma/tau